MGCRHKDLDEEEERRRRREYGGMGGLSKGFE